MRCASNPGCFTSEGEPRGLIDIRRQRADVRAAVDFARQRVDIDSDRIVLWGTSFGGGHVLAAAAGGDRIAAAIMQNPFVDGRATVSAAIQYSGRLPAYRLAWRALRDVFRSRRGREPLRVAPAGSPVRWR